MRITSKDPPTNHIETVDAEQLNSVIMKPEDIQEIQESQAIHAITTVGGKVAETVTLQSDVIMTENITAGMENVTCLDVNQQEVTAADNLVALANSGVVNVQTLPLEPVVNLPIDTLNNVGENMILTQAVTDLGLPSVNVDSVKELQVQSVDTPGGPTKHYILVLHHAPATQ